jgi:hypothetical protein
MAFANGLSERMEELRFPNPRSPNDEPPYTGYTSPSRGQTSFYSSFQQPSSDSRLNLQRRFTTDSSKTSMSSYGSQYSHMKSDYTSSVRKSELQTSVKRNSFGRISSCSFNCIERNGSFVHMIFIWPESSGVPCVPLGLDLLLTFHSIFPLQVTISFHYK